MSTNPQCPFCKKELDDEYVWYSEEFGKVNTENDEESDITCPNCENQYRVCCVHQITFQTIDPDDL